MLCNLYHLYVSSALLLSSFLSIFFFVFPLYVLHSVTANEDYNLLRQPAWTLEVVMWKHLGGSIYVEAPRDLEKLCEGLL